MLLFPLHYHPLTHHLLVLHVADHMISVCPLIPSSESIFFMYLQCSYMLLTIKHSEDKLAKLILCLRTQKKPKKQKAQSAASATI